MAKYQPEDWVPDARTLIWAFGRADSQRIKDALRLDVRDRAPDPAQHPDEYWAFVAEAAIEALHFDVIEMAQEAGAVFSRETYLIAEDEPDS